VAINRSNEIVLLVKNLLVHPQFPTFLARVMVDTIALMEMVVNGAAGTDVN
jgi:hypothetical protein